MAKNIELQKTATSRFRDVLKTLCPELSQSIDEIRVNEAPLGNFQSGMALYIYIKKEDSHIWGNYLCQVAWACNTLYPHKVVYLISGLEADIPTREYEIPIPQILKSKECRNLTFPLPTQ
jgi:hypothetical protein